MSSVTFNLDTRHSARIAVAAISVTVLLSACMAYFFWKSYSRTREANPDLPASSGWSSYQASGDKSLWSVFFRPKSAGQGGSASANYRLAGTYFEFGAAHDTRKAILDEMPSGQQHIVSEGQSLSDLLILSISADHVLVRAPSGAEEELWLSFRSSDGATNQPSAAAPAMEPSSGPGQGNTFGGKQVGENRWVFERQKLMDYYSQLRAEPERLVKLFDSFKPVYTDDGKINGYEIEVFGEQPFFSSTGLRPGDRVTAVNSLEMTNRRRAEYLISEFVKERINVVVMDVERDGKIEKFIYQIR